MRKKQIPEPWKKANVVIAEIAQQRMDEIAMAVFQKIRVRITDSVTLHHLIMAANVDRVVAEIVKAQR